MICDSSHSLYNVEKRKSEVSCGSVLSSTISRAPVCSALLGVLAIDTDHKGSG